MKDDIDAAGLQIFSSDLHWDEEVFMCVVGVARHERRDAVHHGPAQASWDVEAEPGIGLGRAIGIMLMGALAASFWWSLVILHLWL